MTGEMLESSLLCSQRNYSVMQTLSCKLHSTDCDNFY